MAHRPGSKVIKVSPESARAECRVASLASSSHLRALRFRPGEALCCRLSRSSPAFQKAAFDTAAAASGSVILDQAAAPFPHPPAGPIEAYCLDQNPAEVSANEPIAAAGGVISLLNALVSVIRWALRSNGSRRAQGARHRQSCAARSSPSTPRQGHSQSGPSCLGSIQESSEDDASEDDRRSHRRHVVSHSDSRRRRVSYGFELSSSEGTPL